MAGALFFGGTFITVLLVILCIVRFDQTVVFLMRHLPLHIYPTAVSIATLIYEHPEQWSATTHTMNHEAIGSIWTANNAYGIKIETGFGTWKPSLIERRIIRNAIDWRIHDYLRNRIAHTIVANQRAKSLTIN